MRIWLDPTKLQKYALMPSDVISALTSPERRGLGRSARRRCPPLRGQRLNGHDHRAQSRLRTAGQFQRGHHRQVGPGAGSMVRLRDVARIELGSESYGINTPSYNGKPSAGMAMKLAPGANALTVSNAVKGQAGRAGALLSEPA
jgi:multidrug efflux pump subunit AcrB